MTTNTTVKRGDTHDITLSVTSNNLPVDLTGSTATAQARAANTATSDPTTPITLAVTITDPTNGILTHTLTGTLPAGQWNVEVVVTAPTGKTTTYPTTGFAVLTVTPNLS